MATGQELELTLEQAVRLSVSENLSLKTVAYDPALAETAILKERGIFDPEIYGEYSWAGFAEPLPNQLSGLRDHRTGTSAAGIRHRIPLGWAYSIEYRQNYDSLFLDRQDRLFTQENNLYATLVIPLLRGAGSNITRAGIDIAKLNHEASLKAFEQAALDLVLEVERAYWELVQARLVEDVRRRALANSQQFLTLLNTEITEGAAAPFEAFEAEQNVNNQRRDLEQGVQDVILAEQRLSRLLGVDSGTRRIIPTQLPNQGAALQLTDVEATCQQALLDRPLIRQADLALEVIARELQVAENQLLPRLNAVGEHRIGDSDVGPYAWQVGLELSIPLGNREARARHDFVLTSQNQALVKLDDLRQRVRFEVTSALSFLEVSQRRTQAAEEASSMAQKRVDAELTRFEVGFTPSHRVIFAQQQQIVSDEESAVSQVSLELAKSTLRWAQGSATKDFSLQIVPYGFSEDRPNPLLRKGASAADVPAKD
jgi:outer membrane protein TolC